LTLNRHLLGWSTIPIPPSPPRAYDAAVPALLAYVVFDRYASGWPQCFGAKFINQFAKLAPDQNEKDP